MTLGFVLTPVFPADTSLAAIFVVMKDAALMLMLLVLSFATTMFAAPPVCGLGKNHTSTPHSPEVA